MSDKNRESSSYPASDRSLPFAITPEAEEEDDDHVFSSVRSNEESRVSAPFEDKPSYTTGRHAAVVSRKPWVIIDSQEGIPERRVEIKGNRFLIGREQADLALSDRFISRWHAQLFMDDGALVLEDIGSHNGVYLRIADDFVLEDHDEIVVGSQRVMFRTSWDTPATKAKAVPTLGAPPSNPPARLIVYLEDGHIHGIYPIGDRLSIGRQGADINHPGDPILSAPHAAIERQGEKYYLCDLRSQLGTFIRVRGPVELIDGDCFLVGRTRLRINYP